MLVLRETCKDLHETSFFNKIYTDDILLIKNPEKPRPFWKLGRVIEIFRRDDNKISYARINQGDGALEIYSLKHLYLLELSMTHNILPLTTDPEVSEKEKISSIKKAKLLRITIIPTPHHISWALEAKGKQRN